MKLAPIPKKANLYRDVNTQIIYYRRFKKGFGEIKKSLQTTIIREAEDRAEEVKKKYFNEETKEGVEIRKLIEDEAKEFLELQKTKSKATYESTEIQFRIHLLPFFGEFFTHEINEVVWERYIAHSKEKTPGRKLFNDRKYFTMFMWHLHRQGRIKRVPKFRDPDPEKKPGKVFSEEEIERLLACAGPDLQLQILMGYTMGMRIGEILSLEWGQIDVQKASIYLPAEKTKIRKSRTFVMSPIVLELLKERHLEASGTAVFASPRDPDKYRVKGGNKTSWATCRRNTGKDVAGRQIPPVTGRFHELRHTFLTNAFRKFGNPALICHYAGLSLEEAERTYLHFNLDDTIEVAKLITVEAQNDKKP